MRTKISTVLCFALVVFGFTAMPQQSKAGYQKVVYKTIKVDGLDLFYREAGNPDRPTLLLLHGFPSSSFMYRDLINDLSANYHLIAPDYPGFGLSSRRRCLRLITHLITWRL